MAVSVTVEPNQGGIGYLMKAYIERSLEEMTSPEMRRLVAAEIREALANDASLKALIAGAVAQAIKEFPAELIVAGVKHLAQEQLTKVAGRL